MCYGCYTYRGPGFVSQYPHISSLTSFITYVPENPLPSGLLQDQTPIWCTCISGDEIDLKHLLCSKRLKLLLDHTNRINTQWIHLIVKTVILLCTQTV